MLSCFIIALSIISCTKQETKPTTENKNLERAQTLLDSLYKNYSVPNSLLLRETYPFDNQHKATYLASKEQTTESNQYSYLWPFSGTFSAVNALVEANTKEYLPIIEKQVLPGLEEYFDTKRVPEAYASYINSAPLSDRFYDDNVWLGIDFTDIYMMVKDERFLDKAKLIWKFIESGTDNKLGGGVYWCEQKKDPKTLVPMLQVRYMHLSYFRQPEIAFILIKARNYMIGQKRIFKILTSYILTTSLWTVK